MKTRLSKVYNKLPNQKIDLSSVSELQEVSDLFTIDTTNLNELIDAKESLTEFDQTYNTVQNFAQEFVNQYEYLRDAYYDMPNVSRIETALDNFASNAETLGVDPKSVDIYNVLEEQYLEISDFSREVEDFIDNNIAEYEVANSLISL